MSTKVSLEFRGAAARCLTDRSPELGMVGSAGTGKTVAALYKMHLVSLATPKCRSLLARKEGTSLAATTLQAFNRFVAAEALSAGLVYWYGGSQREPAAYQYTNGATIQVGGLDRPERIMSAEFDRIMVDEATDITEDAYQLLLSRLRANNAKYRQILLCCNPQHPTHWLKLRADAGKLSLLTSLHRDNPQYFSSGGEPTEAGREYMARLDSLQGVRRLRLRDGIWAAAEGVIYDGFNAALHVVEDLPAGSGSWPRLWSVDFGFTHPFVWQCWAIDPDGRMYLEKEIYRSQRLVEDHARDILAITKGQRPIAIVCDHDAEDRATLERHLGMPTVAARKSVSDGIQAVAVRLKPQGDGRPRLFVRRQALQLRDQILTGKGSPSSTLEEIPGYVWDENKDQPVKERDDGCDALRYAVAHFDLQPGYRIRYLG